MTYTEEERAAYLRASEEVRKIDNRGIVWHRDGVYHIGLLGGGWAGMVSLGSSRESYDAAFADYYARRQP